MATVILPRNDPARYGFLTRVEETGSYDESAGQICITKETLNNVREFNPKFEKPLTSLSSSESERSKEYKESSEAFDYMTMCMQDTWESARRKARRLGLPAQMLKYYQLPMDGKSPYPTRYEAWYVTCQKMIEGAEEAVKAGYPPVTEPTVEELKEAYEKAREERKDVAIYDSKLDEAQEELEELREQADELISDVMAELRFFLRKTDDASRNRIMKRYGVEFKYLEGEPEDEEAPEAEVE